VPWFVSIATDPTGSDQTAFPSHTTAPRFRP
jgi:hypothetical protein